MYQWGPKHFAKPIHALWLGAASEVAILVGLRFSKGCGRAFSRSCGRAAWKGQPNAWLMFWDSTKASQLTPLVRTSWVRRYW